MCSSGTCILLLLDILSGPLISLVYPLFATVQAIENSTSNTDLRPLLTYWVLYSLIAIFELVFSSFLEWIRIWGIAKVIVFCMLVLPSFNGSAYVYEQFLKPFVFYPQLSMNFSNASSLKEIFNARRSTYNGNRSNSHIYDDRSSNSRRVGGHNYDD